MRMRLTALFGCLVTVIALAGAGSAAAATAPTASTGPVSAVGPTTATVVGSVNPNGTATTWYVEYGTTTGYGSKTSSASAGSGTTGVALTASLASLKPGTSYHYRFVAVSTAGTGHGADGIFTTSFAPGAVTGSASNVTPTSATLNGTVNPSGRPTTSYFEYGTSTSYGTKTAVANDGQGTDAAPVSAAVTRLTAGRTYHFRLVATSDAGTSHGADQSFVAAAGPTVVSKSASSVTDTTATLNGSVNPNGPTTAVYFEYGTSTSYGTKTPAKSVGSGAAAKNVSAGVTRLARGTTYHFRLIGLNSAGSTASSDQTFRTPGPPGVRTGAATAVTETSATLTGAVDPDGHSTNWYFDYGTTTGYGARTAVQSAGSSVGARAVSAPIGNLTPGVTYHLRLVAASSSGTVYGADTAFTTVAPTVSISAAGPTVVFGRRLMLRGTVSTRQANATVSVFAARPGGGSYTGVATVLTGPGGTWSLVVRPRILTRYKVLFGSSSAVTTVTVRPAVSLVARPKERFVAHVTGARSFVGHKVQMQRQRLDGTWQTIARARLGARSRAVFHPHLPKGRSVLRVAISAAQAGTGYRAGFSLWLTHRRH
jgi:hypothetical protein